ncbi:hypothetical protein NQ318_014577 [Aromia moschata]|uniref:Uncharacterized protein n=1 Tax=Aromia moschata TaxID=1265417 RepID=A0AAV8XZB8_9CUCU|nr:hypothetical protein NQ318_014577 [Aromia moschata]
MFLLGVKYMPGSPGHRLYGRARMAQEIYRTRFSRTSDSDHHFGAVSLVLAIAGCICAKSYNRPFFLFFGVTLCVILCLELTIAVIAFNNSGYTRRVRTEALMELEYSTTDLEYFDTVEMHVSVK